jgi:hypothetical protein
MVYAVLGLYILSYVGTGAWRWGLAQSIGPNWANSTRRWRHNPVSETVYVLNRNKAMDNVKKHNNCLIAVFGKGIAL